MTQGAVRDRTAVALLLCGAFSVGCGRAAPPGIASESVAIPAPSLAGSLLPNAPRQPALVLLPRSYSASTRRYPVLYFLAGFTTDVGEFVDGSLGGLDLRRLLAEHATRRPDAEALVVLLSGRTAMGGSFYVDSPVTGQWEQYVVRDAVQWVDTHYRTLRATQGRLLAGEGMGGFGAIHIAMRHADVFGGTYALDPEAFDDTGLDDLGLVTRPSLVKAWLLAQQRMADWPPAEGPERLVSLGRQLYAADSQRFNRGRLLSYAYGAAFAPDPAGRPPYAAYPWSQTPAGAVFDERTRRRWENGYGGWSAKVTAHLDGLRRLRAIGLDVAAGDVARPGRAWIVRGGREVAARLRQAGLPVESVEHAGEHYDALEARLREGLLPFLARFVAGPADGAQSVAR